MIAEGGWPFNYAGLYELALKRYLQAIALDPGFGLGHYNVGAAYHAMGQLDNARAHYARAIECMGPSAWVLAYVAMVHIESGQAELAVEVRAAPRAVAPRDRGLAVDRHGA